MGSTLDIKSPVLTPAQITAADADRIGGKACRLWQLEQWGYAVPAWCVVPADWQPDDAPEAAATALTCLGPDGYFAVRSSAPLEDGAAHSFAGQFATELYVAPQQLAAAIGRVQQSATSGRVLAYCRQHGLVAPQGVAVIVQRMVAAEVSGVAFGLHPTAGDRFETVISALYGLGEGLVGGALDADAYTVHRSGEIHANVACKTRQLAYAEAVDEVCERPVPENRQAQPAMTEAQIRAVAAAADRWYRLAGRYADLEFCFAGGQFYLLQARPVTGLDRLPDGGGERVVWDNSNIVESYPGLTLPLTFSFIVKMYEAVYRQFAAMMGVSAREIDENRPVFATMLGLLRGRVYYNLLSWYRALSLLPGYRLNAGFMEQMMGVRERFEPARQRELSRPRAWLGVARSAALLVGALASLPRRTRRFEVAVEAILAEYRQIDFDTRRPAELLALYRRFEAFLVQRWQAPLINDFFAMIYFGVLQKLCAGMDRPGAGSVANDLLAGSHDIRSTEPLRRLRALCHTIRRHPVASPLFRQEKPAHIWRRLRQEPALTDVANEIDDYLAVFGDRCTGELQLETCTWNQQPEQFVALVQDYLFQGAFADAPAGQSPADVLRAAAEQRIDAALHGRPVYRLFFGHVLRQARRLVSQRENLRLARTRGFGVVRGIFRALGRRFAAENLVDHPDDIFYLRQEEVFDCIEGKSVQTDWRALVALRRSEYERWAALPAPAARLTTYGIPGHGNDLQEALAPEATTENPAAGQILRGLGCCAGRVRGRALVVTDPRAPLPSSAENLVLVAASTDPGWITLFPVAAAVVVERGSLLSHSAIVARELGIPCVVAVPGLLARVRTGDWLEVDGGSGEIRVGDQ